MTTTQPTACYVVGCSLLLYLFFSMAVIVAIHLNSVPLFEKSLLLRTSAMCSAFGMLGASIASIRKYYRALITESNTSGLGEVSQKLNWDFGWLFYYLTRPILGATLGAIAYVLTFIIFEILTNSHTSTISNQGNMMLYAFSLLAGYSVSHVLDRLSIIATQIFDPNNG
jgi:hypothetical protein